MARYKFILAYDGSAFAGSQRQALTARSRTGKRTTVQGELEKALRALGWNGRSIMLAGRTDAGAHASGQVGAADLDWLHSPEELRDALNARLPFEMVVREAEVVAARFHPRFDASSRGYRYRLFCGHVRDPLRERTHWRVWPAPQPHVLIDMAGCFVGRHDFAAFGSAPAHDSGTVRTVGVSHWRRLGEPDEWQYDVEADAFLYRMVRRLVFVQIAVAQGRCSLDAVEAALDRRANAPALPAGLAPAHGLELLNVDF